MTKRDKHTVDDMDDERTEDILLKNVESNQPTSAEEMQPEDTHELSTLQKMKRQASEDDEIPSGSLRLREILGGDYLWTLVRHHIWLIILIVFITTAYVAVRYQCQQDVIDINQLEKDLVDAKFRALSSSSNLTRMCRQSSILQLLRQHNDSLLQACERPPFIIEIPE